MPRPRPPDEQFTERSWPKAKPTFFLPTAPMRATPARRTPTNRSCLCRLSLGSPLIRAHRAERQLAAGLSDCHVYLFGPRPARVGKVWLRCAGAVAIGSFKKGAFQGSLLTSQRLLLF